MKNWLRKIFNSDLDSEGENKLFGYDKDDARD